jgi:tripartite-type tricarboxylate transporter receptor subunit TctC
MSGRKCMYTKLISQRERRVCMKKRKKLGFLISLLILVPGLLLAVREVRASDYPNHPIKMIVGFTAGGPADSASMIIAKKVSEFLGQPIVSEYKPGGGGVLGATYVAKSKPDGYTVCVGTPSPFLIAPLITSNLDYTLEEFIPISGYCLVPLMINVKKGGRWNTLTELVEDAKKNPGNTRTQLKAL